jgi:hypothetical protein
MAAQPSLHMEGKGSITFCAGTPCGSRVPAPNGDAVDAVVNGVPFGQSSLHIDLSVRPQQNGFSGCYAVKGTGTLTPVGAMPGTIAVIFHGQECTEYAAFGQLLDSISGSIQMYDTGCWDAFTGGHRNARGVRLLQAPPVAGSVQ